MCEYPIRKVPLDAPSQLEQLGTKAKFWFPAADGTPTLFKEGYPGSGEHWAEKIACEVARGLNLPHAEYELATCKGRPGVVSPMMVPDGGRLIHGNELLARVVPEYDERKRFRASQHTLGRVLAVLRSRLVATPSDWTCPAAIGDAAGVFVGYLLLDALIANQDRHHENWGLIKLPKSGVCLAPNFDHGSSLGRNESDAVRRERLSTKDTGRSVATYVRRAQSSLYKTHGSRKPMTTFDAFADAAAANPAAARFWIERLDNLDAAALMAIVSRVPSSVASEPAKAFALAIMIENRNRLLAWRESDG
ncbi:MAG: hypothetical protein K9L70_02555 [Thiohalocapsa sp.]|nr:hypothetical protein [Thiohalocapsa sp.]MCF7990069.1 hypothetical protein [Thiohalocapsa sp.]